MNLYMIGYVLIFIIILSSIMMFNMRKENYKSYDQTLRIHINEARSRRFNVIYDVRTIQERELYGYYPNSIPLDPNNIKENVLSDIGNKNAWILIYSNNSKISAQIATILYKLGYTNVRYINEGYESLMPVYLSN